MTTGQVWLESTLSDRPSSGIPDPDAIFQRLRRNIYKFVFGAQATTAKSTTLQSPKGSGRLLPPNLVPSGSSTSVRQKTAGSSVENEELVVKEYSIPAGSLQICEDEYPLRLNSRADAGVKGAMEFAKATTSSPSQADFTPYPAPAANFSSRTNQYPAASTKTQAVSANTSEPGSYPGSYRSSRPSSSTSASISSSTATSRPARGKPSAHPATSPATVTTPRASASLLSADAAAFSPRGRFSPPPPHLFSSSSASSAAPASSPPEPECMEELFAVTAGFSPCFSSFADSQQRAKMRCFRRCFDNDDDDGSLSRDLPDAFLALRPLFRYFLRVSNSGKPFLTCQMMDATLATLISPVVEDAVLGTYCIYFFSSVVFVHIIRRTNLFDPHPHDPSFFLPSRFHLRSFVFVFVPPSFCFCPILFFRCAVASL